MTNKNELNNEELNKVSGGYDVTYYDSNYKNKIDKNDVGNHIGETLYFETYMNYGKSQPKDWFCGSIISIYNRSVVCDTERRAKVNVIESRASNENGGTKEINIDYWTVYSK